MLPVLDFGKFFSSPDVIPPADYSQLVLSKDEWWSLGSAGETHGDVTGANESCFVSFFCSFLICFGPVMATSSRGYWSFYLELILIDYSIKP